MLVNLFTNMFVNGVWFCGGLVAATIVWFFVLRNNKKNFNAWMDSSEAYLMEAIGKIDGIGEEASAKIDAVFANFKELKK